MEYHLEYNELVRAGFVPRRFGFFVRFARRIIWPLVRPFHLHIYHDLLQLRDELRGVEQRLQNYDLAQLRGWVDDLDGRLQGHATDQSHTIQRLQDRVSFVIDHLDSTRGLYGHLADEMPKFVQPLVDIKGELAGVTARCVALEGLLGGSGPFSNTDEISAIATRQADIERRLTEVSDLNGIALERYRAELAVIAQRHQVLESRIDSKTDTSPEMQAIATRQASLEQRVLELFEGSLSSFNNGIAEIANKQAELETRIRSVSEQQLEAIAARQAGLEQQLSELSSQSSMALSRYDAEVAEIFQRHNNLEHLVVSKSNADLEMLSGKIMELSDRFVEFESVAHIVNGLKFESESLQAHISGNLNQTMGELQSDISQLKNHIGALGNMDAAFPAVDGASLIQRVGDVEQRLSGLNDLVSHVSDKEGHVAGELDRLRNVVAEVGKKTDELTKPHLVVCNAADGIAIMQSGDLISQAVSATGRWDSHIVDLMDDVASTRPLVAVDVGAHFGMMTLAMARRFQSVHCFEPNDFSFKLLSANININRLQNVTAYNLPLFSRPAVLSLGTQRYQESELILEPDGSIDPLKVRNIGGMTFAEDGTGNYQHDARTLDSYELNDVSFIKIDCQGTDGEVLMGAMETIRRCKPVIVFEWETHLSANFSVNLLDLKARLKVLGYSVNILMRHNEKQADYVAYPIARG